MPLLRAALGAALIIASAAGHAESILIRNARVHTVAAAGTLEATDVLISGEKIAAVGKDLAVPAGARVINARGRPMTPGLFGGLTRTGVIEIGLEPTADDDSIALGGMRPEFDLALAYNPSATAVGVNRADGVTFVTLAPSPGGIGGPLGSGSILAGQGALFRLDGRDQPEGPGNRAMFIEFGGDSAGLAGGSRAAQFMLLHQAFVEARTPAQMMAHDERLLTVTGRQVLADYLKNQRLFVINVDRAVDIRRLIAFAREEGFRFAVSHGDEAWRVARELAAAKVAVILDPLDDLPENFDKVGASLQNAARLAKAGVPIAFSIGERTPYGPGKQRQTAGNAVAHGLDWDVALAAITRTPAEIFGVADRIGSIEIGKQADLVLWSGDPLEVTTLAEQVIIAGKAMPTRSRQTELRDRYMERLKLR